jgi:hypothetical protein
MEFHFDNLTTSGERFVDWKTEMPRLKNFKETKGMDQMTHMLGHSVNRQYIRCMLFKADEYLPLNTFVDFVKILALLGHTIVSTTGFKLNIAMKVINGDTTMDFDEGLVEVNKNKTFNYINARKAKKIDDKSEEARARRPYELLHKKNEAARKIQRAFKEAIANPAYKMCRDRLMREFADLGC